MQDNQFNLPIISDYLCDLSENKTGRTRNFKGYHQHLENRGGKWRWVFYVTGFIDDATSQLTYCHVLKADGSKERVSIDAKDRILINGRRYDRSYWNH